MANFTSTSLTLAFLLAASLAIPNRGLSLKLPEGCKGKGFCSIKPEGYDEMMKMVEKYLTPTFLAQNMGNRIGGGTKPKGVLSTENDWHNCPYRKKTEETPYVYKDSHDPEVYYIVQHNLLSQPIEIVTCATDKINRTNPDGECFQHLKLTSLNLTPSCKSFTYDRYLIAIDNKTRKPMMKPFPIPCCCSCVIQHN